jgi:hypothetical protein
MVFFGHIARNIFHITAGLRQKPATAFATRHACALFAHKRRSRETLPALNARALPHAQKQIGRTRASSVNKCAHLAIFASFTVAVNKQNIECVTSDTFATQHFACTASGQLNQQPLSHVRQARHLRKHGRVSFCAASLALAGNHASAARATSDTFGTLNTLRSAKRQASFAACIQKLDMRRLQRIKHLVGAHVYARATIHARARIKLHLVVPNNNSAANARFNAFAAL